MTVSGRLERLVDRESAILVLLFGLYTPQHQADVAPTFSPFAVKEWQLRGNDLKDSVPLDGLKSLNMKKR